MRAYVFPDKTLERYAGRFVWLSVDTENTANAGFLRAFPIRVWPTILIIDPSKERVLTRWAGGATIPQLRQLLVDGEKLHRGREKGPDVLFARAEMLYGEGKNAEAATAYREALRAAPPKWPRYGRVTESLLYALRLSEQYEDCAGIARAAYPRLKDSPSAPTVAGLGLGCSLRLSKENSARTELIGLFEANAREVLSNPKLAMTADDRSEIYRFLSSARNDAGDAAGRRRILEEHASFLEREAKRAQTPEQRAVFDSARLGLSIQMGHPEQSIPMLQASERDLPHDYNPPVRLALAYKELKRYSDAVAAVDRALGKAYGSAKVGVLRLQAEVFQAQGDRIAARNALHQAVQLADSLPEGQRNERIITELKKKLTELPQ